MVACANREGLDQVAYLARPRPVSALPIPKNSKYTDPTEKLLNQQSSSYYLRAPVAQWVKHWPTDQADRVRSSLR